MKSSTTSAEPDVVTLVEGIVADGEKLLRQQFDLFREEIQEVKTAAIMIGAGGGLFALAGGLSSLMLVHVLHRSTRLPLWSCYGIVGGLAAVAGTGALNPAVRRVADLGLLPHTRDALRQNVSWLKKQTSGS
jgi:Putative Actinobacterial Holin-X, holin superfamily III